LQHPVAAVAALAKAVAVQCIVCKVAKKSNNQLAMCVLFGISAVFLIQTLNYNLVDKL